MKDERLLRVRIDKVNQATSTKVFTRDFVLLCVAYFTYYGGHYLLLPILPLYVIEVGGNEAQVGMVTGAMTVATLATRVFAGHAADNYGKKLVTILGLSTLAAASGMLFFANNVAWLILIRLIHGIGLGTGTTAFYALCADLAPDSRRGEALGYFGTMSSVAMALSPVAAVAIWQLTNSHAMFVFACLIGFGAVPLTMGIKYAGKLAPGQKASGTIIVRRAIAPSVMNIFLGFTYGGLTSFLPLFALRQGLGNVGLFYTVDALAIVVIRVLSGKLTDRFGRYPVLVPGYLLMAAAFVALLATRSTEMMVVSAAVYGLGYGATLPTLLALAADRVKPAERGVALGMIGCGADIGIGSGGLLLGLVLQASGFEAIFLTSMAVALAGMALALVSWRRERRVVVAGLST